MAVTWWIATLVAVAAFILPHGSALVFPDDDDEAPAAPAGELDRTDLGGRQSPPNYNSFKNRINWASELKGSGAGAYLEFSSFDVPSGFTANKKYYIAFGSPNYSYVSSSCGSKTKCRFLHHCPRGEIARSYLSFLDNSCPISRDFIGVCCPQSTGLTVTTTTRRPTTTKRPAARRCGTHDKTSIRIVGGQPADPGEYPWMAALLSETYEQVCGGVLISPQFILSAAHCLVGKRASDFTVRLGEYDFSINSTEKDYRVAQLFNHPNYNSKNQQNDISLIKLATKVRFTDDIRHICLPSPNMEIEGKMSWVIGFGVTCFACESSEQLLELSLPVWKQNECKENYLTRHRINLTNSQICAGYKDGKKDSCQGDSGGPLMMETVDGQWYSIGIVSFGLGCARPNAPGVYTRVSDYLSWIFTTVRNNN